MLLVADVHLGKVSHFRKHGSAVPLAAIEHNFNNLNQVLQAFEVATVCFLGDLFHSDLNGEWMLFEDWCRGVSKRVVLVAGNHDVLKPERYQHLGIELMDTWQLGDFLLTHHPTEHHSLFNFCGHVHPAVRLVGWGKQRLTLPCFFQSPQQLILPSFGAFTGSHRLVPGEHDQAYVIAEGAVTPV